jgi:hypothetical protein
MRLRNGRHRGAQQVALGLAAMMVGLLVAVSAAAAPDRALHGVVNVEKTGNGSGHVGSDPGGIDCGDVCSFSFVSTDDPKNYRPVSLSAQADPGSAFDGFGGACSGDSCTIDPLERLHSYDVSASFSRVRPSRFPLTVNVSGQGRVLSSPAGIDCDASCSTSFPTDSVVTLTATATPGWSFSGWGGACSGLGTCSVTMSDPRTVTASFAPPETAYALAVAVAGGSVVSDIKGINCGDECVASYGAGVSVTLTPASTPVTWGGACTGAGACVVEMSRARAVTATFGSERLSRVPLAVSVTGKGVVASAPEGIDCGTTCGVLVAVGSPIVLHATPAEGWIFAGWQGACRGVVPSCTVAAKAAAAVTAAFVEAGTKFPVAVTKVGQGTVRSAPPGIACGSACTAPFLAGTTIAVDAVPRAKWTFVRWSGACRGSKPSCTLAMNEPKSVSATFAPNADQVAPRVKALVSAGVRSKPARLRYRVHDASGRSRETAKVSRRGRRVAVITGHWHAIDPDALFYFIPWPKPLRGNLRFCISSVDPTGNRSKPSCASLHIR